MSTPTYNTVTWDVLGSITLERARDDLAAGVVETAENWGERIEEYLANVGITEPQPWCAAAVSTWIMEAEAQAEMKGPIIPTPGAQQLMHQFRKAGRWLQAGKVLHSEVRPGMVAVWDRGRPGAPWRGHAGVVSGVDGSGFLAIEGNATPQGDRVAEIAHTYKARDLFGFGQLSGPLPRRSVAPFLLTFPPAVVGAIYLASLRARR